LLLESLETIIFDPPDLFTDAVDLGVVLRALHRIVVDFDGEDLLPSARKSESNGVPSNTSERVDDNRLLWRSGFRNVFSDSAEIVSVYVETRRVAWL
jgi:hypothetical protein